MTTLTPHDRKILREAARKIAEGEDSFHFCCNALKNLDPSKKTHDVFVKVYEPDDMELRTGYLGWFGGNFDGWNRPHHTNRRARTLALLFLAEMREGELP